MKIRVEQEKCIACGFCGSFLPEVFTYDHDGNAYNVLDNNSGTLDIQDITNDKLIEVIDGCPTEAIVSNTSY